VKELVVGHVLERKLALRHVARVRLAKHGVTVAGNDTSRVEGLPPSKKSSFIYISIKLVENSVINMIK
jgi:hypothetical protein